MDQAHQRIGQVLAAAFSAEDPPLKDWAEVGFKLRALEEKNERLLELIRENAKSLVTISSHPPNERTSDAHNAAVLRLKNVALQESE